MMFEDPANPQPWPQEIWAEQMEEGEIALFCVNFKNGLPVREEDGRPGPQSDQVCRVSSDLQELERHAQEIVKLHPSIVCVLRGKDGREVKRISNRRFLGQYALVTYAGCAVWLVILTALGTGILWLLGALVTRSVLPRLSWKQWAALLAVGAGVGILVAIGSVWVSARRRANRLVDSLRQNLTPQEKLRYSEIDRLAASADPEDKRRGRLLSKEYQERVMEITRRRNRMRQ